MGSNASDKFGDQISMNVPADDFATEYDRRHMLTYARLLDAERDGQTWREAAAEILLVDVASDPAAAERCWRSHLARAHWVVGAGLASIISEDEPPR